MKAWLKSVRSHQTSTSKLNSSSASSLPTIDEVNLNAFTASQVSQTAGSNDSEDDYIRNQNSSWKDFEKSRQTIEQSSNEELHIKIPNNSIFPIRGHLTESESSDQSVSFQKPKGRRFLNAELINSITVYESSSQDDHNEGSSSGIVTKTSNQGMVSYSQKKYPVSSNRMSFISNDQSLQTSFFRQQPKSISRQPKNSMPRQPSNPLSKGMHTNPPRDSLGRNSFGSKGWTTTRKLTMREYVVSVMEYCSNEVGIAVYNVNSSELYLAQIIERMTYFRTLSTIERFSPLEILHSTTLDNSPLIRRLSDHFCSVPFRSLKRQCFDETRGFQIYQQRGNRNESHPDNKFVAFAALNALIGYLEKQSFKLAYSSLKIRWHLLEQILVVDPQAVEDLELFLNASTKQTTDTFIENFKCLTHGGTRMLRANILQPLASEVLIRERQNLVERLLHDRRLMDVLISQLPGLKVFEPVTSKLTQNPREENLRSLKTFLSAIYSLSHLCGLLQQLAVKLQEYSELGLSIINRLLKLLKDSKLAEMRKNIETNFEEDMLKDYQGNRMKRESFIFLFKADKIGNDFAHISRITYSRLTEDIHNLFRTMKTKSNLEIRLSFNEYRGFYLSAKPNFDLSLFSQLVQDDVIQISEAKSRSLNFSTAILVSLNNRLRENQKRLLLQSQLLLRQVLADLQKHLHILFDINYELSTIDMAIAFVGFIKKFSSVDFTKPVIQAGLPLCIEQLRSVWTSEKYGSVSDSFGFTIQPETPVVALRKRVNSFAELNVLYSIGYTVILAQIGCYVPAKKYHSGMFETLFSKMTVGDDLEAGLSRFEMELYRFKNILESSSTLETRALVLIDELVKGTQYEDEVCLSLALLEFLSMRKGNSFVMVSDSLLYSKFRTASKIQLLQSSRSDPHSTKQEIESSLLSFGFPSQFLQNFRSLQIKNSY